MEWKYVKPLKDESSIEYIEKTYHIEIPKFLKEIIVKYNGGRPEKKLFDTKNSKERVVQGLISFNKEDRANIFIYEELLNKRYLPFGITEFGDLICVNNSNQNVEIFLHEIGEFEYVCNTIEDFFNIIYMEDNNEE